MRIAIIDDGVCKNQLPVCKNIRHYYIDGCTIKDRNALEVSTLTHGTVCASIISQTAFVHYQLVDIKIFENNKASIEDFMVALDWCFNNNISIINMSFGTINYIDFRKMEKGVQKLIDKGVFIVAAHHNNYLKSYPAIYRNVFGVRKDEGKHLINGEFGFQLTSDLNIENCLVAHYDVGSFGRTDIKNSNSFVTPVITGHIVNFLKKQPSANFNSVLKHLQIKASHSKMLHCKSIYNIIHGYTFQVDTPIICFYKENRLLFNIIRKLIIKEHYEEFSFVDFEDDCSCIPFRFYCNSEQRLSLEVLSTFDLIYDCDIFLLCLDENRYCKDNIFELIDLFVVGEMNRYRIESIQGTYYCETPDEILQYIINYFD